MPSPVRMPDRQKGKLDVSHYHPRHVTSECWSCEGITNLAFFTALGWEFYCASCEVIWT